LLFSLPNNQIPVARIKRTPLATTRPMTPVGGWTAFLAAGGEDSGPDDGIMGGKDTSAKEEASLAEEEASLAEDEASPAEEEASPA